MIVFHTIVCSSSIPLISLFCSYIDSSLFFLIWYSTCYLAGKFIRQLKESLSGQDLECGNIDISDDEILAVELAALCHDLGEY